MAIRPFRDRDDAAGIVRAHGAAWRAAYADVLPGEVVERMPLEPTDEAVARQYERLAPHADRVFVADDAGVVGYAFVRWEETKPFVGPGEAGLKEIYVHPDRWGEGIGTALLDRGIARLPADVTALKLEVLADNDVGRRFYEARGFEHTGSTTTEIAGDEYGAAVYTRRL